MAIPDKRYIFDYRRPRTPLSRMVDFYNNPSHAEAARFGLYLECAKFISGVRGERKQQDWAKKSFDEKYSVHFNVWTQHDIIELILYSVNEQGLDLDFETIMKNNHELIVILRKTVAYKDGRQWKT